ncbi:MAG TPA: adenosyl-hopene transferase HpnH [Candidatus Binatia bacterium]|nr:adenosyl-hopene transferase HpnH [Candidatus Binatia bacterium]
MRFPLHIATDMMKWQLKNWWRGNERYPYVLMLEPLHTCNLACIGCSPERYNGDLKDRLSLAQCLESVDESGAPVVSICGGEPTIYPELPELVDAIIARKRHIYLCTNGLLLERFYRKAKPHPRLSINVHVDGLRETHDMITARTGTFDKAIDMIREGKRRGFHVCTNTTVYRETSVEELEQMMEYLTSVGVDGMLVSPGYHYEAVSEDHCMGTDEIQRKFERVLELAKRYSIYSTPLFLEFAAGKRDYPCTPWGGPTRTPKGWKGPCYLIEGEYYPDWKSFMGGVDWQYWESRKDPRCRDCKMHSGFEHSAVRKLGENPRDVWTMMKWNFGFA